MISNYSWFIHW